VNSYSPPTFIPECVPPMCNLCTAFVHNSNSCLQYVRLKVEIENSIKSTFNSIECMMGEMFHQFLEVKQNWYNFYEEEHMS